MHNTTVIGAEAVVVESILILHITVGHTKYVPIQAKNVGPQHSYTSRTQCGATRCQEVKKTTPDRSGRYLLVKLM